MSAASGVPEALRKTIPFLEAQQIPCVVIGGLAASLQGEPRFTDDVDIMVTVPSSRIREFAEAARAEGFTIDPELAHTQWLASGFVRLWLGSEGSGTAIDLMACNSDFLKEVIWRAQHTRLFGLEVRIPTVEDLMLLKVSAWRQKDIVDLGRLALRHEGKLDREHLTRWASWLAEQNDYFAEVSARLAALLDGQPLPPAVPD